MTEMPVQRWTYPARVVNVVDADSLDVQLDLGFGLGMGRPGSSQARLRLLDVWAPEVRGSKASPEGAVARDFVRGWVAEGSEGSGEWPFLVETVKTARGEERRTLGRYVARLWRVSDGAFLNLDIVRAGHASASRPTGAA